MLENPHVAVDEESTQVLNERYMRHVSAVNQGCAAVCGKVVHIREYHISVARGLYKVLTERSLRGDTAAVFGAPHWLLYSNEQVKHAS